MFETIDRILAIQGLAPHGYCLLWNPALVWTHVFSDALIAAAYFSIPVVLWRLLAIRNDLQFGWMLGLFATFILACGLTHVVGIVTLWIPAYGWEALIKLITAAASVGTAVLLIPLLPRLAAIPSPASLQAANDALRREAELREETQAMLRQSQKMEAVGQLTGGVAHDFNNLLGVVIGNLDRIKRKGGQSAEVTRSIENALAGAERAAKLTEQLLAFARKQPLHRERHDLNDIVMHMADLLRETVGRHIELRVGLDPAIPHPIVDRNQLENAILNLAVNARDAMDDGGVLTISTSYTDNGMIELAVADTGTGMDTETLERSFEPFFTTKPVGKGSGLGLSQVTGTVEQLGGHVKIDSQPGSGTTVRMFLPADVEVAYDR